MLIQRHESNPILKPKRIHSWEAHAVFNGCPVKKDDKIYLIYRALSRDHYHNIAQTRLHLSTIGLAPSTDGIHFHDRKCIITPEQPWEQFGCEDPRVTKIDDTYYIFYTALSTYPFNAQGIKVGVALTKDLYTIEEKHLVTPFNAKGMALFPEKINGKYWATLTVHTDMPPAAVCLVSFDHISDIWNQNLWQTWYENYEQNILPLARSPHDHVECGATPLKTDEGWLMIYSYIKNYFTGNPLFGIEAVLLDLENPKNIIAHTKAPLLTPDEYYERIGIVPNVVFPTGILEEDNNLHLYYGAADTTCCRATINKDALITKLLQRHKKLSFTRAESNPILSPIQNHAWESRAVFNPAAIHLGGTTHIIYRAMSQDNTSVLGYATTKDGIHIDYRATEPIYVPRASFEQKKVPNANTGCEDPRITLIDDRVYMLYTAVDGQSLPRVALTFISTHDFLNQAWDKWAMPVLISPPGISNKNSCIFPEKIHDNYFIIHRSGDDIDSSFCKTLDFDGNTWLEEYRWICPRPGHWDSLKIGMSAPPIKTEKGWVLLYHGVSTDDHFYRVGALLLDLENPTHIIARTDEPLFEPEMPWELEGQVNNVVFPCGAVLVNNTIYMYYGGADQVIGVATMDLQEAMECIEACKIFWKKD